MTWHWLVVVWPLSTVHGWMRCAWVWTDSYRSSILGWWANHALFRSLSFWSWQRAWAADAYAAVRSTTVFSSFSVLLMVVLIILMWVSSSCYRRRASWLTLRLVEIFTRAPSVFGSWSSVVQRATLLRHMGRTCWSLLTMRWRTWRTIRTGRSGLLRQSLRMLLLLLLEALARSTSVRCIATQGGLVPGRVVGHEEWMRKRGRADRKKRKEKGEWAFPGGPGSNVEFLGLHWWFKKNSPPASRSIFIGPDTIHVEMTEKHPCWAKRDSAAILKQIAVFGFKVRTSILQVKTMNSSLSYSIRKTSRHPRLFVFLPLIPGRISYKSITGCTKCTSVQRPILHSSLIAIKAFLLLVIQ